MGMTYQKFSIDCAATPAASYDFTGLAGADTLFMVDVRLHEVGLAATESIYLKLSTDDLATVYENYDGYSVDDLFSDQAVDDGVAMVLGNGFSTYSGIHRVMGMGFPCQTVVSCDFVAADAFGDGKAIIYFANAEQRENALRIETSGGALMNSGHIEVVAYYSDSAQFIDCAATPSRLYDLSVSGENACLLSLHNVQTPKQMSVRMLSGSTPETGANYTYFRMDDFGQTRSTGNTEWELYSSGPAQGWGVWTIEGIGQPYPTQMGGVLTVPTASVRPPKFQGFAHDLSTAYDGIRLVNLDSVSPSLEFDDGHILFVSS